MNDILLIRNCYGRASIVDNSNEIHLNFHGLNNNESCLGADTTALYTDTTIFYLVNQDQQSA